MRGVDGLLPKADYLGDQAGKQSENEGEHASGKSDSKLGGSSLDHTEGRSQYDYLRRLGENIIDLQHDLERNHGGNIAAIGVVGSDIYDKLLVLRTLRQSFQNVVFFTTDLDALYLDSSEREWTHNLIIASSYGLTASDDLQHRIPPFRDSYQTSYFLTVLQALNLDSVGDKIFTTSPQHHAPGLFQIGRTRLIDFSPKEDPMTYASLRAEFDSPFLGDWSFRDPNLRCFIAAGLLAVGVLLWRARRNFIGPGNEHEPVASFDGRRFWELIFGSVWLLATCGVVSNAIYINRQTPIPNGAFIVGLTLAIYVWAFLRVNNIFQELSQKAFNGKPKLEYTRDILAVLVAVALFVLGFYALCNVISEVIESRSTEEHFAWFQGTSIWPTEILRTAAMVTGVFSIVTSQNKLLMIKSWLDSQHKWLRPLSPDSRNEQKGDVKKGSLRRGLSLVRGLWLGSRTVEVPLQHLWRDYQSAGSLLRRFCRAILLMVVYVAFFGTLSAIVGFPWEPARGPWSRALDAGIFAGSVLSFTCLLFFVLDATLLCSDFVTRLTNHIKAISPASTEKLNEFKLMELIRELTEVVSRLIYFPFTVLFIMIVSRNPLFDNWDWPPALIITFASGLALIFYAAMTLQKSAQDAKKAALKAIDKKIGSLSEELMDEKRKAANEPAPPLSSGLYPAQEHVPERVPPGSQPVVMVSYAPTVSMATQNAKEKGSATTTWKESQKAELRERRGQIEGFDGIAFQPWYYNPIYRAILIPLGGVGSLQLLDKFLTQLPH